LSLRDERVDYGEDRWIALGCIGGRLHFLVYTLRGEGPGESIRIISLRKANARERRVYDERQEET